MIFHMIISINFKVYGIYQSYCIILKLLFACIDKITNYTFKKED